MASELKLKIAIVAPPIESVPPKKYGGTERVIYALTEELVKRGNEVTLYATGDSQTSANLVAFADVSLRNTTDVSPYGEHEEKNRYVKDVYQDIAKRDFNVVHDHIGSDSLESAQKLVKTTNINALLTAHNPIDLNLAKTFQKFPEVGVATISQDQGQEYLHFFNHVGVVHNGLDLEKYPFSNDPDNYLLYVGRISDQKGTHHAANVANELDMELILAAKLDFHISEDVLYYERFVKPLLSGNINWIGEVDEEERNRLMCKALAFLHPVKFREPFGLTLIEAEACGAPVIAFPKGAIPEIVADGETGFVVENSQEMVSAVLKIDDISREVCRTHALKHFSGETMTDGYEELYSRLVNGLPHKQS